MGAKESHSCFFFLSVLRSITFLNPYFISIIKHLLLVFLWIRRQRLHCWIKQRIGRPGFFTRMDWASNTILPISLTMRCCGPSYSTGQEVEERWSSLQFCLHCEVSWKMNNRVKNCWRFFCHCLPLADTQLYQVELNERSTTGDHSKAMSVTMHMPAGMMHGMLLYI